MAVYMSTFRAGRVDESYRASMHGCAGGKTLHHEKQRAVEVGTDLRYRNTRRTTFTGSATASTNAARVDSHQTPIWRGFGRVTSTWHRGLTLVGQTSAT